MVAKLMTGLVNIQPGPLRRRVCPTLRSKSQELAVAETSSMALAEPSAASAGWRGAKKPA